jgi:hypothetical protein
MAKKFSKWLFVTRKTDRDTSWLDANESQVDATENADTEIATVATYELVAVKKLKLMKTVEFVKAAKK